MIKQTPGLFGAVHVGSEQVSAHIVQYKNVDDIAIIEEASRQVALGEETFKTGQISFSTMGEICELLKGYRRMFAEYGVRDYRLLATTAIREAENRHHIIDQIKVKTGFTVEVLDVPQEIFYKYAALFKNIQNYGLDEGREGILFVDISSGGLGITLYENGSIKYQQNIHIGVLRVKESFDKKQRDSAHFQQALAEYIYSVIEPVQQALAGYTIQYLVLAGIETRLLLSMLDRNTGEKLSFISLADFYKLYDKIIRLNLPQIMEAFRLSEQRAEMVLPTLVLYKQILDLTAIGQIVVGGDQMIDGLTLLHIAEKTKSGWLRGIEAQIISLARSLGAKYQYDVKHAVSVEGLSLLLFDKLVKVHGLEDRDRFVLQTAAILHDIGKFVSLRTHYYYSYRLIMSSDILGFSDTEKTMMANIAYYHSKGAPASSDLNLASLTVSQKITVAKLAAIIRLADALDRTHRQKIKSCDVAVRADELVVTIDSQEDFSLEEWTFAEKADFFESVFGIRAVLRNRRGAV